MAEPIFPSREYWTSLDVNVPEVLGLSSGPKRRRGLRGWTGSELAIALKLTGERVAVPSLSRESVRRWFIRRAPTTSAFLTLLSTFASSVSPSIFIEVANDLGISSPIPSKRSLSLLLFSKDPANLQLVQTRARVGAVQATLSYRGSKSVNKAFLLTKDFQSKLLEKLSEALGESSDNVRLDLPRTSKKDDYVVYGVIYRGPKTKRKDWRGPHFDYPILRAVMRVSPSSRFLELYSRKKDCVPKVVSALGELILGDAAGYRPLTDSDLSGIDTDTALEERGVQITSEQLSQIQAENVPIEGTPDILVSGNNLAPTIAKLEDLGIDLRTSEVARQVRVYFKSGGVGGETLVTWNRRTGSTAYKPLPPAAVRRLVMDRISRGSFGR